MPHLNILLSLSDKQMPYSEFRLPHSDKLLPHLYILLPDLSLLLLFYLLIPFDFFTLHIPLYHCQFAPAKTKTVIESRVFKIRKKRKMRNFFTFSPLSFKPRSILPFALNNMITSALVHQVQILHRANLRSEERRVGKECRS